MGDVNTSEQPREVLKPAGAHEEPRDLLAAHRAPNPPGEERLEIRKLQKVGSSTLSVSLPSTWAAEHGLHRGASVQLVEDGREMRIIPLVGGAAPATKDSRYIISADECREAGVLSRVIVAAYVLGRDRVVIRSRVRFSADQLDAIRRTARKLIGMGVIQEDPGEVVLQCSIESQRYPVDAMFKRLYNLAATTISDSLEALRTHDLKLAQVAASREDDSDMIYWLIMRQILSAQQDEALRTLIGIKSRADVSGYSIIATELERIGDHTRRLALAVAWLIEHNVRLPGAVHTAMRSYAIEVGDILQNAMLALLSRELEKGVDASVRAAHLRDKEEALALATADCLQEREARLQLRRAVQGLVLAAEASRGIAIIAFSRHQSETTRFIRAAGPNDP